MYVPIFMYVFICARMEKYYMYVFVHMYVFIYVYVCASIIYVLIFMLKCMYVFRCMFVFMCMYAFMCMYVFMCIYAFMCIYVFMCKRVGVCMYVCTYIIRVYICACIPLLTFEYSRPLPNTPTRTCKSLCVRFIDYIHI